MTPENFVYWLQGLLELQPDLKTLSEDQVKMIRQHLEYVFARGTSTTQVISSQPQGAGDLHRIISQMIPGHGQAGQQGDPFTGTVVC